MTIINENTKIQYETDKAYKQIENIFRIKELLGISLKNLDSPLIIDAKKQEKRVKLDIIEKILQGNNIKTKNHSIYL